MSRTAQRKRVGGRPFRSIHAVRGSLHAAFALCLGAARLGVSDDAGLQAIPGEELAVLKAVIAGVCERPCGVDDATMSGRRVQARELAACGLVAATKGMVDDFNARNAVPCSLPPDLDRGGIDGLGADFGERRSCQLSRPGFDKDRQRALVLAKLVYAYPEDIMNEGKFVMLSRQGESWVLERAVQAWAVRPGK